MPVRVMVILSFLLVACQSQACIQTEPMDCQDVEALGHKDSGVYHVTPPGTFFGIDVYCDMATDGGGWLVVQRRQDGSQDFFRGWEDYQIGFGNNTGEFWLGNLKLHVFTSANYYELRFDMEDWDGNRQFAKYRSFAVGDSSTKYKIKVDGYYGDANDSMAAHNGMSFTTKDRDNDIYETDNCAKLFFGAWWYRACHSVNINGLYLTETEGYNKWAKGINWEDWLGHGYSLKKTEMKIRRR